MNSRQTESLQGENKNIYNNLKQLRENNDYYLKLDEELT